MSAQIPIQAQPKYSNLQTSVSLQFNKKSISTQQILFPPASKSDQERSKIIISEISNAIRNYKIIFQLFLSIMFVKLSMLSFY